MPSIPRSCGRTKMKLHDVDPDRLLGDKGYDSDEIRDDLVERGIEPVIQPRSNRKTQIEYDREAYKRRNLIERCVNRLKQFRRIATRYEKTARAYLSMLCIAAARLWIKTVNTAFCNGPVDVNCSSIATPPSSRFCPWSAPRPPHYAVRGSGEPI